MIYYIAILALTTGLAYLSRVSESRVNRSLYLTLAVLALVAFSGLRHQSVGTDTITYVRMFTDYEWIARRSDLNIETGFIAVIRIARAFGTDYSVFLIISSALAVLPYLLGIKRVLRRYELGIYIFIVLGLFTFSMNGMRQAIAMGISFWALPFVLQRRIIPYLGAVAVAFLFHRTAIAAVPIYFLASARLGLAQYLALAAAFLGSLLYLSFVTEMAVSTFGDRFSYYSESTERGGILTTLFLTAQGLVLLGMRHTIRVDTPVFTRYLNVYLFGLVPAWITVILSLPPSGIMRLHFYYTSVSIILWPTALASVRGAGVRTFSTACFAFVTLVYFLLTTQAFSDLVPYSLNAL
jgi:hypothetical protein